MNLVIIEGVGKKDTIKKYLGDGYEVFPTKGHVRDLPLKTLGINVIENFKPQYQIMPDKEDIVKKLKEKSLKADKIYLATDPDREGEAISWHLCHILNLDENAPIRIEFNEISKPAIMNALQHPRGIDENLVNAQQTRRILDRLVGYKISPIICKKIQSNLSAGRVQSVALKLVVDREKEINAFKPEEYWTLIANLFKKSIKDKFKSSLNKIAGKKQKISSKDEMDKALDEIRAGQFIVSKVEKTQSKTHPSAPYTTSTMQQDALNKLGMSLKKASSCAQELYEGVTLGKEGKVALITYIRTDSVRVSPLAMKMAHDHILEHFGEKYLPEKPNYYKVKSSAQDAHEAIRPISLDQTPDKVKEYLSPENYKLYKLIYSKFLASQMSEAVYDVVTADIDNGKYSFRATGRTTIFDGFLAAYEMLKKIDKEEKEDSDDESGENSKLPELFEGDVLNLESLIPTQKFTKPPARYTEASLVKEMEEKGIGRPATYTPTILLLANRNYTEKEGKFLKPTELAFKVDDLLAKYFSRIINVKFTAGMEDKLDEIANKGIDWHSVIGNFYNEFVQELTIADKDSAKFKEPPKETDIVCDKCGHKMVIRTGKYGEFLACSNYPACKNIMNNVKPVAKCPKCGGNVFERHSKKGTKFFGCDNYPKCDFVSWEIPISEKCPKCGSYMTEKTVYGKLRKKCSSTTCDYVQYIDKTNETKVQ